MSCLNKLTNTLSVVIISGGTYLTIAEDVRNIVHIIIGGIIYFYTLDNSEPSQRTDSSKKETKKQ